MTLNERPGIYTSYEVSSALAGSGIGGSVGIAAKAGSADTNKTFVINSYADAISNFGSNSNMTELIRLLFLNGAPTVIAAPVAPAAALSDYTNAFDLLKTDESVRILICDSRSPDVLNSMMVSILSAPENCKFRIGVGEASGNISALISAAEAINCERMVLAAPIADTNPTPGSVAAALTGVIAAQGDPAVPLNGAFLLGINSLSTILSDNDINSLVRAGITPIEVSGGRACVIRGITTRSKTGGTPDATWRELTTVLILDDVISTIKNSLRTRFARAKNTLQTRGAIRTQVIIELENKLSREIIDAYDNVTVAPAADDPTVCEVSFEFAVSHGLNQIFLSAHITV